MLRKTCQPSPSKHSPSNVLEPLIHACMHTYTAFAGNVLEPLMFGHTLKLHPVTVLLSLMVWGSTWGVTLTLTLTLARNTNPDHNPWPSPSPHPTPSPNPNPQLQLQPRSLAWSSRAR